MIILQQGVANKSETLAGRSQSITLTTGAALGADMIVKRDTCRRTYEVRAVTFVMVTILHRHKLLEILNSPRFEVTRGAFRKIVFRTIFRKEFVRYARMFARIHGARESHQYDALEHNTTRVAVVRDKGSEQHDEGHLEAQAVRCRLKEEQVKGQRRRASDHDNDHGEVNAALAAGGVPHAAAPGAPSHENFGGSSGPSVSSGHIVLLSRRLDTLEDSQVRRRAGLLACSIACSSHSPPPHTHNPLLALLCLLTCRAPSPTCSRLLGGTSASKIAPWCSSRCSSGRNARRTTRPRTRPQGQWDAILYNKA